MSTTNCSDALKLTDEQAQGAIAAAVARLHDAKDAQRRFVRTERLRKQAEEQKAALKVALEAADQGRRRAEAQVHELELALKAASTSGRTASGSPPRNASSKNLSGLRPRLGTDPILLLVGLISYRTRASNARRSVLRGTLQRLHLISRHPVALRFVLAQAEQQGHAEGAADELTFPVAQHSNGRVLGHFMLSCAFLQFAVTLRPQPRYIGSADDDVYFLPSTILDELLIFSKSGPLVYGVINEWYMWDPLAMMGACFSYSPQRYFAARLAAATNNSSNSTMQRQERECLHSTLQGPFPFAKGSLVVYDSGTAARLVASAEYLQTFRVDTVGARQRNNLMNPLWGRAFPPSHPHHPGQTVLNDDIFFGWLLWRTFAHENITLIAAYSRDWSAWLSEPRRPRLARRRRAAPTMQFVRRITSPSRWRHVNNTEWIQRQLGTPRMQSQFRCKGLLEVLEKEKLLHLPTPRLSSDIHRHQVANQELLAATEAMKGWSYCLTGRHP